MLDLHTHILPAVDDGAGSVEEALEMLALAEASGDDGLVLTPHYLNRDSRSAHCEKEELTARFEQFKKIAAEHFPKLMLFFGAETFATDGMHRMIEYDRIITLNNSKYVLLEFGFEDNIMRALDVVSDLTEGGFVPIIAHPERYTFLQENNSGIDDLLKSGALLQVNATSLGRRVQTKVRDLAVKLLREQRVSVIASDSHDVLYRTPDLSKVYDAVSIGCSRRYAEKLFRENPAAILKNYDVR